MHTMLKPILYLLKMFSSGRLADTTPIIPVIIIQMPNQMPDPLLLTQKALKPTSEPIPKDNVITPIII